MKFVAKDSIMSNNVEILNITKNKKKFNVTTTKGDYIFCEDTIIENYVLKGKIFSEEEFNRIIDSENKFSLYNKTLNFISYQMRSVKEIVDYLKAKDASKEQIEEIIRKITNLGYLNDYSFANNMLESLIIRQKGPLALQMKLKEKGIDEEVIAKTMSSYDDHLQEKIALEIIKSQIGKNTDLPAKKQKQLLYEKLIRNGFSGNVVSQLLSDVDFIDESDETLEKEIARLRIKYRNDEPHIQKTKMIANLMNKGYEYQSIIHKLNE